MATASDGKFRLGQTAIYVELTAKDVNSSGSLIDIDILTGGPTVTFVFEKPDRQTTVEITDDITVAESGGVYTATLDQDPGDASILDQLGKWKVWMYVTFSDGTITPFSGIEFEVGKGVPQ